MDKQQTLVIDRALKQLSDPTLAKSKAAPRLEKLLVGARKSGQLSMDELRRATVDLVDEIDVPKYFSKAGEDGADADATGQGLAILFLLLLLSVLAALADEGSDAAALIEDLIQALLDLLKGP